jgi:hypothetical protein
MKLVREEWVDRGNKMHTFLSFMEFRWSWMIDALFFRIIKHLSASFVNAFLRHGDFDDRSQVGESGWNRMERFYRILVC